MTKRILAYRKFANAPKTVVYDVLMRVLRHKDCSGHGRGRLYRCGHKNGVKCWTSRKMSSQLRTTLSEPRASVAQSARRLAAESMGRKWNPSRGIFCHLETCPGHPGKR